MSGNTAFNAKEKFESIYGENQWGKGSGEGSLPENTVEYRKFLEKTLKDLKVKSVLDLGCGDWQISSLVKWGNVHYTGVDVVQALIDENTKAYGNSKTKFIQGDISNCDLPSADMIIIKDVLQHWPTDVILRFLPRLQAFKYALIINDNYPDPTLNGDPDPSYGHFRPVALLEAPFNLKNAKKIFSFRTDPKMPEGFNNKEVLLASHTEATVKKSKHLLKKIENIQNDTTPQMSEQQINLAVSKAINSLDEVVGESRFGGPAPLINYNHTVGAQNIKSGSTKARIARKLLSPFGKITRKLFEGYLQQQTEVHTYLRDMAYSTELKVSNIEVKVNEAIQVVDRLKREVLAEIVTLEGGLQTGSSNKIDPKIVNPARVRQLDKVNVGSGVDIREDYINLDGRPLEGIDVVADVKDMPFKVGSLDEVFAKHVAEHFVERDIKKIFKYWFSLLKKGGRLRIIVPNIDAMAQEYGRKTGRVTWEQLRAVALGGQDYASDYHFNHFSVQSMRELINEVLPEAKFEVVAEDRRNGECLEMEITATRVK